MKNIVTLFCMGIIMIGIHTYGNAQTQKGTAINGEAAGDFAGIVSMPDENTIAIGAPNNDGNGLNSGHVRIFTWNGSSWVQKGDDLNGENADDQSGSSVSMPNSNTVFISAPYNDGNGMNAGHVRVFTWNGTAWIQKGTDIDGKAENDRFGFSISAPDENTVAIGAPQNDDNGTDAGHVRIYTWNGSAWVQKGNDIVGKAAGDNAGASVSMPDANTVAIGATGNDENGMDAGHVRIYTWNGSAWVQKGNNMDGEAAGDFSGISVSMPDVNTVAIGAIRNDGSGIDAGHTRIYTFNGNAWVQKGNDIDGEAAGDFSGSAVSMPNSNTVAIGARNNNGSASQSGHVRVFTWNGAAWVQNGTDINGEAANDRLGGWNENVCMPNANTLACGAVLNDGNGADAGQVRVFTLPTPVKINAQSIKNKISVFPSITTGKIAINLSEDLINVSVSIRNSIGQVIHMSEYPAGKNLELMIEGQTGLYLVEVIANHQKTVFKILKE